MTQGKKLRLPIEYFRAHRLAAKAICRGDIDDAHKWMGVIERLLRISERENFLIYGKARPAAETPKGPVMLDPKGYSPGGTPNWYLNQQRRDRAGLK